ncbi:hypothetical protein FBZ99_12059 [Rhizobium sp. ERR 1071]|uniref:hypothetical protein n=1 Tax=Rhizobium sp. ERR 1071 TaxID=2572677 RepID=UPI00119C1F66|nr:hypothetical protein [Rhizobium sp. ERR1071]TWB08260.1 hypothetical protein FBZ99_12059 [Rhizobium sp. ERR1071]
MAAEIVSIGGMRALLAKGLRQDEGLRALRDDFECAFAIFRHAVQKDLPSFTFSGLRLPPVFNERLPGAPVPYGDAFAFEIAIFQEHLHDRITLLAQNRQMLREIWAFNERTRWFRQIEIKSSETAGEAVDETARLIAALQSGEVNQAIVALAQCEARRIDLINALTQQLTFFEHPNKS